MIKEMSMALKIKKNPVAKKEQVSESSETKHTEGPQEIQPVRKKHRLRNFLLYAAAIGFAFYAVITIINQNVRIAEKKAELREIVAKNKAEIASAIHDTKYSDKDYAASLVKVLTDSFTVAHLTEYSAVG